MNRNTKHGLIFAAMLLGSFLLVGYTGGLFKTITPEEKVISRIKELTKNSIMRNTNFIKISDTDMSKRINFTANTPLSLDTSLRIDGFLYKDKIQITSIRSLRLEGEDNLLNDIPLRNKIEKTCDNLRFKLFHDMTIDLQESTFMSQHDTEDGYFHNLTIKHYNDAVELNRRCKDRNISIDTEFLATYKKLIWEND